MAQLKEQHSPGIFSHDSLLQAVCNALPIGVVVIDPEDYSIVELNNYAALAIGLTRQEIIGQSCRNFFCPGQGEACDCDQGTEEGGAEQDHFLHTAGGSNVSLFKRVTTIFLEGRRLLLVSFVDQRDAQGGKEALSLARDLKRSVSHFQSVLESTDDFIWAIDRRRCLLYWNQAFARHLKRYFSVSLEKGMSMKNLLPPQLEGFWERTLEKGLVGKSITFEYRTVDKRDQLTTVNPLRQDGQIVGCAFFAREITELKQTEAQLRESEKRFRAIFDNLHTVMLVIDPATGQIEDANPAAANFYGYPIEKLTEMSIMDLNVLSREEIDAEMSRAVARKKKEFNFLHRLADGTIRTVEVYSGPITIHKRKLLYSIIHDVTERKRMEADLEQYKKIVSSSQDLIALVDSRYVLRMVNTPFATAYNKTISDLVDQPLDKVVGQRVFVQVLQKGIDRAFGGAVEEFESWVTSSGSGRRFMSIACTPVADSEGKVTAVAIDGRDVTPLKQMEEERKRVFDFSLDMLCVASFDGYFKKLNPAWSKTLGWSEEELKKHPWLYFVIDEDKQATIEAGERLAAGESIINFVNRYRCKDGSIRWISWNSHPDKCHNEIFAVARDVTANKHMEEELRRLATTDALTGIANRRHFLEHAEQEVKRAKRYADPLVMLSLDLDHFKLINDTYGHEAGDECLVAFVQCCTSALRGTDFFGRIGGEEFLVLLTNAGLESGWHTARRLRQEVKELKVSYQGQSIKLTVSIGLTLFRGEADTLGEMMRRADHALYEAKALGRNQVTQEL